MSGTYPDIVYFMYSQNIPARQGRKDEVYSHSDT